MKIIKILIVTILIILIPGCKNTTDNFKDISYEIKVVDIYSSLPASKPRESNYTLSKVYLNNMIFIEQVYLRNEWGAYGIKTSNIYKYNLEKNKAHKIDFKVVNNEIVLSMIEMKDNTYFYIISKQNDESYSTFYYLDSGDRTNLIYQTNHEQLFEPSVVVENNAVYFVVSNTQIKDIKISRGYFQYLDLKIYRLNSDLTIDTIFESKEDLYAFYFDNSSPISFLTVENDGKLVFNTHNNETIRKYHCDDDFDGIAAFGGNLYGIHDNWGKDDRELYWYDVIHDIKIPMARRAEAHKSLGNYEIVIDNEGVTILMIKDGKFISCDVEGLDDALYIRKINDNSAFIICRNDIFKIIEINN